MNSSGFPEAAMNTTLTIVLGGQVASVPYQGGATWAVLQYLLGLQELGHRVYFVERIPETCLVPPGTSLTHSHNSQYFRQVTEDFDLRDSSALIDSRREQAVGLDFAAVREIGRRADVLINLSGYLPIEPWFQTVPVRLYVDLDPLFTQFWSDVERIEMHFEGHTHFATIGMAVGSNGCAAPAGDREWIKTWQPVVLTRWPVTDCLTWDAATTVANWRSYGSVQHGGDFYGQKVHSWRQLMNLPLRSRWRFVAALSIDPQETEDLGLLLANRWELVDPRKVAATPQLYQQFIQCSKAELAIAKSGYVKSRCGWFSERSACYLASGKPVVAQATGFEQYLPCGKGVFAFTSGEQALEALAAIDKDYTVQCRAARCIAEEFFDSGKVLTRLLAQVGVGK
jgi:hypothetical protein